MMRHVAQTAARTAVIAGAGVVLATTLGACSDAPATDPVIATSNPTQDPAAHDGELRAAQISETHEITDDAEAFFAHFGSWLDLMTTAKITLTLESDGVVVMTSAGQIDYTTDPFSQTQTITGIADEPIETRMVDGTLYANLGAQTGGKWTIIGPENPYYANLQDSDPLAEMRLLDQITTGVQHVGPADLDGTSTDHYIVTVDTTGIPQDAETQLPPSLDYEFWLDSEGRPVQMVADIQTDAAVVTSTMSLTNFGAPSTIEPPPADQLAEMS